MLLQEFPAPFYKLELKFVKESGDFSGIFVAAMKFKQRDGSDCGPACLGFVADYYRLRWPLARIGQIARTDEARLWVWRKRRRIWVFKRRAFGGCLRVWQTFPNRRLLI